SPRLAPSRTRLVTTRAASRPPSLRLLVGPSLTALAVPPTAAAATAAAATTTASAVARRAVLARLTRRSVLRTLDQLFGTDRVAVLVLLDQLEADPAASLVDLLHAHVEDVAAIDDVLDVTDTARPDVRDVEQAVRTLLELDERAELRRLDDLRIEKLVSDLGLLRQGFDGCDRRRGLLSVGRVDEDRPVLLDVDLHFVVGFEAADRLAALADHHADLLGVDLHGRDARCVLVQLGAHLRNRLEHLVEDDLARPLGLLERRLHDLPRNAGDLDVHLQAGDALARSGDFEVHVTEMVLGALDVGEDDVVVALFDEAHRDAGHRCLDRHPCIHEREGRAADRAHRRRAVRLERLGHDADGVGELVCRRDHRLERALCERTVTDVTTLRASHEAGLPDRVGREVVVVHEAAVALEREVVDPLAFLRGTERQQRHDLRLTAREETRAVHAR